MTGSNDELLAAVAKSGLDIEQVIALVQTAAAPAPTIAEHVDGFLARQSKRTRQTYQTHLRRFAYGFGPVCDSSCVPCMDPAEDFRCCCDCRQCEGARLVLPDISPQLVSAATFTREAIEVTASIARRTAIRRGAHQNRVRAARGKLPKAAGGAGAETTAVAAMRALYQAAKTHTGGYDGLDVAKPHRGGGLERRPLQDFELIEVHLLTGLGGDDPELDLLLVDYGLQTGARRSGAYGLTVGQIFSRSQLIKVRDKHGTTHDAPVSAELINRLLTHAVERGGPVCDPSSPEYRHDARVFYYRSGSQHRPVTSRRFDTLHARWQSELDFAAEEQLGYHHLRHTMSHILKVSYGPQYAKRYLRHSQGDITDLYGACTTSELARALAETFEFSHPLVDGLADRRAAVLDRLSLPGSG